tara:strand:+ start:200 stop:1144 length:945 start_codon:yes stop_codon:yes gene_type:complete
MAWAQNTKPKASTKPAYTVDHYRDLFNKNADRKLGATPVRMALVGKENTAKTGLALSLSRTPEEVKEGKKVIIFDFDNSAEATVRFVYPNDPNVIILKLFDEMDDSIFEEDGVTVLWHGLVKKVKAFVTIAGDLVNEGNVASIIFDGGSTFSKWCEFSMRESLLERGVTEHEGDSFNQKEWQERNRLFRDTLYRVQALPVDRVFFTFHLKDHKQYLGDGGGKKVLMKVGEKPDWIDGTQRNMSQQIFLARYTKKGDDAAGVKSDKTLKEGEFVVRATVEEMKGTGSEFVGTTHDVLLIKNNKVTWNGLPDMGLI